MTSTKKPGTVYATVRSPKHVGKLLDIYAEVEGLPKATIEDNTTIFDKHDLLPKLFFEKQTDPDGDKIIVLGSIKPFIGFLQDEELFGGEIDGDKVIIKVQDDLTIADINEGLADLCTEWGWTLHPSCRIPGQAGASRG